MCIRDSISGVRNAIESVVCPYPTLAGPLWAAVTASVSERYKDGRDKMDSIYSGVGTFRWMTFICVSITAVVSIVRPILPTALSLTLLVQGFICVRLAIDLCENDTDKGLAGVMGGVILARGAAWGLAVGVVLYLALYSKEMIRKERQKNLEAAMKKKSLTKKHKQSKMNVRQNGEPDLTDSLFVHRKRGARADSSDHRTKEVIHAD